MDFKRFSLLIATRTILAMLTLIFLTQAVMHEGYHATILLLSVVLSLQFFEIMRFISKTNAELVRFFDAVRHADFSQRFELKAQGAGFEELGETFTDILKRIQTVRSKQEAELRHIKAIIEHVPVPLLSIDHSGKITLWNNSVRRLFGANTVTHIDDMAQFNKDFPKKLQGILAGERTLVNITIDGMEHKLIVSATEITTASNQETLLSMQDIQSELALAQLQAWQDLVSVLTHEIMNSITPVASLAKTAVDLVEDVQEKTQKLPIISDELSEELAEDLEDVLGAVKTVARRSDGLMQFVTSYRRLTRLASPNKKLVSVATLFNHVTVLAKQNWQKNDIELTASIVPQALDITVDSDMIEQVLLNLVLNAEQALAQSTEPKIYLHAFLNVRGHVVIEVADNGKGIEDENMTQIFVPFFTTKKEGSGVGLALTRQVMLAHNGKVAVRNNDQGGATFSLTF
ncbi:sensor histidine kinase [Colwellia psychrerythraea]|uniref:histidine kinase n=1 Tax=Colwellia psychrerythraea TaxID=28229 RepID=A0A099KP95_COLPS|nr:PAS domain-containing sensor histidine kinase [Colwellia psychrerythraea]KGJ91732.1 putative PAS/PAC sensor protein [Colwellia psychrerythraea]